MTADHPPAAKSRTGLIILLALALTAGSFVAGFGAGAFMMMPRSPFLQDGYFNLVAGQEGMVTFPIPYSSPPNVVLEVGGFNKTVIVEITATGFKWKNSATEDSFNSGKTRWTARGLK